MNCAICKAPDPWKRGDPERKGVTISRCCCDSDWVCADCVADKTLAEYIEAAV